MWDQVHLLRELLGSRADPQIRKLVSLVQCSYHFFGIQIGAHLIGNYFYIIKIGIHY
jgi:hypothetical protein